MVTQSQPVKCEIKNGLYHPWSLTKNSAKGYLTIIKSPKYVVATENSDLTSQLNTGVLISEGNEDFERWVQVSCKSGGQVYIQDSEMLKLPGAKEGIITDFGSVGPATEN